MRGILSPMWRSSQQVPEHNLTPIEPPKFENPYEDQVFQFSEDEDEDEDDYPIGDGVSFPTEQNEHLEALSKGLFFGGGVGTYIFLGKTNAGKNYMLEHAIMQAFTKASIRWENIVVYSPTATLSGNYDFLKSIVGRGGFVLAEHEEELYCIVEDRKRRVERVNNSKGLTSEQKRKYVRDTQILIIIDDFAGLTNTSSSTNNRLFNLVSTSRHMGIWLCFLTQYSKILGPAWWQNCRAVVSFDSSIRSFNALAQDIGDEVSELSSNEKKIIQRWPSGTRYGFVIWWNFWFGYEKPHIPWLMQPVNKNSLILQRGEPVRQQYTNVKNVRKLM